MIQRIAPVLKESRLFGVATDAQAVAILLKGYELGLSFTASFEFIHVIEGRPSLSPRGALALILNSPDYAGIEITDEPDACTVTLRRRNGLVYTSRFTMEDAKRADLIKERSGWERYPANMLRWRAIGFASDVVFPDITGGLKRADELGADLTPEGDILDGDWSLPPSVEESTTPTSSVPSPTEGGGVDVGRLGELTKRWGAAAILQANGGKFPADNAELDQVEAALAQSQDVDFYTR
jgi:hypothetical protein